MHMHMMDFALTICMCMQVMTDPDAPSPSEPSMRELIHWSVIIIFIFFFLFDQLDDLHFFSFLFWYLVNDLRVFIF
jgi:hypothetical protein